MLIARFRPEAGMTDRDTKLVKVFEISIHLFQHQSQGKWESLSKFLKTQTDNRGEGNLLNPLIGVSLKSVTRI
jgi:hypothetical protein